MEKLVKREDALKYLTPMKEMGLFRPEENPSPVEAEKEGLYRIPRWEAMIYLEKAAEIAGTKNDLEAARQIVEILRAVSEFQQAGAGVIDNYGTWHSFAKILSALPTSSYSVSEVGLLRVWLGSKFDRGMMVGSVVGSELLPKLLKSGDPADWQKAKVAVGEATRLIWQTQKASILEKEEPVTAVDPYWLDRLLKANAVALGQKCSPGVIEVLVERVSELFGKHEEDKHAWLLRPAIEDNEQNHRFRQTYNVLIDALRDILISYADKDSGGASVVIDQMLGSPFDILKRIAIHVCDERFDKFSSLLLSRFHSLLRYELVHESYRFLKRNFAALPAGVQNSLLNHIEGINLGSDKAEESARLKSRLTHAIRGQGNVRADSLYASFNVDWDVADRHPDFLSYMTSWSGPGPSPFEIEELKQLNDDALINALNDYRPPAGWQGPRSPSIKSLVDAVTSLVKQDVPRFQALLSRLLEFKPEYQYAILNGFRDLSNRGTREDEGKGIDWEATWKSLAFYFENARQAGLLTPNDEPQPAEPLTPTRRWLVPVIADLIRNGTHDDHRAIPLQLSQAVFGVIGHLLKTHPSEAVGREDDAMTEAINTTRGHCLEALFDFALYVCRQADNQAKTHGEQWKQFQVHFDCEIAASRHGNFEFTTLCGAYLANIHYLSSDWLEKHILDIFPLDAGRAKSFDCALQGFAYMPQPTKPTYKLMREKGILQSAIERTTRGRHARQKLIQHICVAYLWGDEPLSEPGSLLELIIRSFADEDIREAVRFFWGVHGEPLNETQVMRVLDFWGACMQRIGDRTDQHKAVLSELALLTVFLKQISAEHLKWLLMIAPYVNTTHNGHFFLEYLDALADKQAEEVGLVTLEVLKQDKPFFDFESHYESIVRKLFSAGKHRLAKEICNQEGLRDLPQIVKLYDEHRHIH